MNTNDRDQNTVARALGELRARANRSSQATPQPDVDALLAIARAPDAHSDARARASRLQPRLAAAAALAVVAVSALLLVIRPSAPEADPASESIVGLVDSLYDESDYLDGVWTSVLDELESTP